MCDIIRRHRRSIYIAGAVHMCIPRAVAVSGVHYRYKGVQHGRRVRLLVLSSHKQAMTRGCCMSLCGCGCMCVGVCVCVRDKSELSDEISAVFASDYYKSAIERC